MVKTLPFWHRLYYDPVYADVARAVGYQGCQYRNLPARLEPLYAKHGKVPVESALYGLTTFEGQTRTDASPLTQVQLRLEARGLCHMLLGPAPESLFYARMQTERSPAEPERPAEPTTKPKRRSRKKAP